MTTHIYIILLLILNSYVSAELDLSIGTYTTTENFIEKNSILNTDEILKFNFNCHNRPNANYVDINITIINNSINGSLSFLLTKNIDCYQIYNVSNYTEYLSDFSLVNIYDGYYVLNGRSYGNGDMNNYCYVVVNNGSIPVDLQFIISVVCNPYNKADSIVTLIFLSLFLMVIICCACRCFYVRMKRYMGCCI